MKIRELLAEAAAVGRKYQHIEDLVFTDGSNGGLHAVERLRVMATQGGNVELKWDGSPVMYWGRDTDGNFSLIPKNAWEYLKRGKTELDGGIKTQARNPDDLKNFILGTGKTTAEQDKQRKAYASEIAGLWPYFEKVSPARGFVEGGLLFYPSKPATLNKETGEYDFTPNITSFHIPKNSVLGQKIAKATVMVAVTGYYDSIADTTESRFPNAESLSTTDVIVQGTTYVEQAPGIDETLLNQAEQYIEKNSTSIDLFLSPKPGLSKPGDILYKFFNQNLRVAGVKEKFKDWVQQNISANQSAKILSDPGIDTVLTAVELLTAAKTDLIRKLSTGTHGGIRQTKPEGYVQAHPGGQFKRDLPGQFVKAVDQPTWAPRKNLEPTVEASYPGNVGAMEVAKFFQTATPKDKDLFKRLVAQGNKKLAWALVQKITNTKLQGNF